MSRRSQYRAERGRSNRDGSIGMAMFKKEEREKAYNERFKPYNIHKTIARAIVGPKRRRRRK
jgi:hypothetical protein